MIGQVPQEGLQRQISPHILASPSGSRQALMYEKTCLRISQGSRINQISATKKCPCTGHKLCYATLGQVLFSRPCIDFYTSNALILLET